MRNWVSSQVPSGMPESCVFLSRSQRRELIRRQLKATPEMSDRQIALKLGVSHHTVASQRNALVSTGQIARFDTNIGADGKVRPRQTQRRPYLFRSPSPAFRYAEGCLYGYKENSAELEQLKVELKSLTSLSVTNYEAEGGHSAGSHSDPVERRAMRVLRLEEKIARLTRKTAPITRLLKDMQAPYVLEGSIIATLLKLLELFYFGKNDRSRVAEELHVHDRTVYKLRDKLVNMAIRYLGV